MRAMLDEVAEEQDRDASLGRNGPGASGALRVPGREALCTGL